MTDGLDEVMLTAAKLHEQAAGDLDGGDQLHPHAGLIHDQESRQVLSFLEAGDLDLGALGAVTRSAVQTDEATAAVERGAGPALSAHVGVTEQELDASALSLPVTLLDQLENGGAPAFLTGAGNPKVGKTDLMLTISELWSIWRDDSLVLANFAADNVDLRVTSCHDLTVQLLEHRDVPKFVIIDEGSTHFDARTNRRPVAEQWTPLAKRMGKIGVDAAGVIVHTGKDLHPEAKRLTTLAFYKLTKKRAELFTSWDPEDDHPEDKLFTGALDSLERASSDFDPNDSAPWSWDLRAELFADDLDWPGYLDTLRDHGPAET